MYLDKFINCQRLGTKFISFGIIYMFLVETLIVGELCLWVPYLLPIFSIGGD